MEKIVALYVALMTEKPKSHPDGPPCWLPTCEVAQDSSPWIYTVSSNSSRMFKVKLKFSWWIPFAYCLSSQFSLVIPGFTGVFSMVSVYILKHPTAVVPCHGHRYIRKSTNQLPFSILWQLTRTEKKRRTHYRSQKRKPLHEKFSYINLTKSH